MKWVMLKTRAQHYSLNCPKPLTVGFSIVRIPNPGQDIFNSLSMYLMETFIHADGILEINFTESLLSGPRLTLYIK